MNIGNQVPFNGAQSVQSAAPSTVQGDKTEAKSSLSSFAKTQMSKCSLKGLQQTAGKVADSASAGKLDQTAILSAKLLGRTAATMTHAGLMVGVWKMAASDGKPNLEKAEKASVLTQLSKTFKGDGAEKKSAVDTGPPAKLSSSNDQEEAIAKRIFNARETAREGSLNADDIKTRKKNMLKSLGDAKDVSKEFRQQALGEIKKLDGDLKQGLAAIEQNTKDMYAIADRMQPRSIEFYKFAQGKIEEKDDNGKSVVTDLSPRIRDTENKLQQAKDIYADESKGHAEKGMQLAQLRGHGLMDLDQGVLLAQIKDRASAGKTDAEKQEIDNSVKTIKRHLTHDDGPKPTEAEVKDAYAILTIHTPLAKNEE